MSQTNVSTSFPLLCCGFSQADVLTDHSVSCYNPTSLIPYSLWKALHSFLCCVNSYSLFKSQFNPLLLPLQELVVSSSGILRYNKALLNDLHLVDFLNKHGSSSVPCNMLTDVRDLLHVPNQRECSPVFHILLLPPVHNEL